jgi:hypothetical protein
MRYSSLFISPLQGGNLNGYDEITAWSTLALAVLSLISCYVVFCGVRRQTQSFAQSVSADLGFKLNDRFDGPALKETRKKATEALLSGQLLQ